MTSHSIGDKGMPHCPHIDIKIALINVTSPLALVNVAHIQRICKNLSPVFGRGRFVLTSHLVSHTYRGELQRGGIIHKAWKHSWKIPKVTLFRKTVSKKNFTIFIMPPRFWISNGGHVALEQIEMKSVSSPAILCCWFFPFLSLTFAAILLLRSILMRALHVVSLGLENCRCTRVLSQRSIIRWLDPSVTHYGDCAVFSIHIVPYVSIA